MSKSSTHSAVLLPNSTRKHVNYNIIVSTGYNLFVVVYCFGFKKGFSKNQNSVCNYEKHAIIHSCL